MIQEEQLEKLNRTFKRLFALPISRMTLKELQNALYETFPGNPDMAQAIYNSLLTGEIQNTIKDDNNTDLVQFIDTYSSNVLIAKEVAELGEFLNSFGCDFMQQGNQVLFMNRMRRIDGQEYHFMSAPDTNIRLAHMFINRLRDLKKSAGSRLQLNAALKEELKKIIVDVEDLLK